MLQELVSSIVSQALTYASGRNVLGTGDQQPLVSVRPTLGLQQCVSKFALRYRNACNAFRRMRAAISTHTESQKVFTRAISHGAILNVRRCKCLLSTICSVVVTDQVSSHSGAAVMIYTLTQAALPKVVRRLKGNKECVRCAC